MNNFPKFLTYSFDSHISYLVVLAGDERTIIATKQRQDLYYRYQGSTATPYVVAVTYPSVLSHHASSVGQKVRCASTVALESRIITRCTYRILQGIHQIPVKYSTKIEGRSIATLRLAASLTSVTKSHREEA